MCKELEEELERGQKAVEALVEHAYNMGGNKATFNVEHEGRTYQVVVDKLPHPDDFSEGEEQ